MAETNRTKSELLALLADNTSGDISAQDARDCIYSIFQPQHICRGRLTTESGVPISSSDRTSQGTMYFTPYDGNLVSLYDGTSWKLHEFTERSLALSSLTSGKNYDVFLYDNSGTLTLELSAAWSSDTARTDALTTQNGIYVKSGATTRRYLGTIRTTGTASTEDSQTKRFVWNHYNRAWRFLYRSETTAAWVYNSSYRQANASTSNQVEAVFGIFGATIQLAVACVVQNASMNGAGVIAVGYDSTSSADQAHFVGGGGYVAAVNGIGSVHLSYERQPDIGYHKFCWLEKSVTGSATFYGTDSAANVSGIIGEVEA